MKLLLITAVEEFEKNIKQILKHSGVKSFSVQAAKGYKNDSAGELHNWFGIDDIAIDSVLFTVFAEYNCVEEIYERVNLFNTTQSTTKSKIHLVSIQIEKTI